MIDIDRLEKANAILSAYSPGTSLVVRAGRLRITWIDFRGETVLLPWTPRTRGSDWPSIRRLPFGGTCTMATMELYRWIRHEPTRARGMWEYFCSKAVGMNPKVLELVKAAGWPERVPCVFCGRMLGNGVRYDHYDRDGHAVGPGCYGNEGCQAVTEPPAKANATKE